MPLKVEELNMLTRATDQWVRLVNVADVESEWNKVVIHVHGKLSYETDDHTYSVCSTDGHGHGTNAISFKIDHVDSVMVQPSGITEITLK